MFQNIKGLFRTALYILKMVNEWINSKEKTSFREICLAHLKRILELSTIEFRGGYRKLVVQGNYSFEEYVPSTSKNYIQAVESFRDILLPHFDKDMVKTEKEITKKISNLQSNLIKEKKDRLQKEWKFELKKHKEEPDNYRSPNSIEFEEREQKAIVLGGKEEQHLTQKKLKLCSELFRELNLLLKRNEYLKSSIYSEEDLEDDEEEEDK